MEYNNRSLYCLQKNLSIAYLSNIDDGRRMKGTKNAQIAREHFFIQNGIIFETDCEKF